MFVVLPEHCRAVVRLARICGLNYDQIAAATDYRPRYVLRSSAVRSRNTSAGNAAMPASVTGQIRTVPSSLQNASRPQGAGLDVLLVRIDLLPITDSVERGRRQLRQLLDGPSQLRHDLWRSLHLSQVRIHAKRCSTRRRKTDEYACPAPPE